MQDTPHPTAAVTAPAPKKKKPATQKKTTGRAGAAAALAERFVPGMTRCRVPGCGARLMVRSTSKRMLDDGRLLIERSVKCQGIHRHTYTLPEFVDVTKK